MRITEMKNSKSDLLSECFGKGVAEASDETLFIKPQMTIDRNKRALIIGLGGSGIKTVNLVKTVLKAKCTDFANRVSFLAIDTDENDIIRSTTALSANEKQTITSAGGNINAFYKEPRRDSFIDSWCTSQVPATQDLTLDGANQKRQISKMKIFYPGDITCPNDMKLYNTIKSAADRAMQSSKGTEELQVFIVLGISGGTGSGGIIDIAQLVRKATPEGRTKITGVFYLPDSMPIYDTSIQANGYAALKELDYYICARQRMDEEELRVSPANNCGRTIYVRNKEPLYDMPILVSGSANGIGGATEKFRETRQAAAEFIVNLLADAEHTQRAAAGDDRFLLQSFFSNMGTVRQMNFLPYMYDKNTGDENPGMYGEDSFSYNAIGVSTLAIPERVIMSYAVNEIVQTLLGESSTFAGKGFKGFDVNPMGRVQGNGAINEILINGRVVDSKIVDLCKLSKPSNSNYTIDDIRSGTAETSYRRDLNIPAVQKKAINEADAWLADQVKAFEDKARVFMVDHGPRAFVCLCKGVGPKDETFDGLLSRLGKMDDPVNRLEKIRASKAKTDRLQAKMNGVFGTISNWLGHHVEAWHSQFLEVESSRIEQAVAEHLYGADLAFDNHFREPIIRFIESCEDFAIAMEELGKVYKDLGDKFETLEKFIAAAQASEPINVNVLEGTAEYEWAKELVDQSIRAVNFQSLKENLVKDFMEHQQDWTDYDPRRPLNSPRRRFDKLVAGSDFALQKLTLTQYFAECVVDPAREAEQMVTLLKNSASPRYYQAGNTLGSEAKVSLLVPEHLFDGNPALRECFAAACNNNNINMYQSQVEDKMVCYRFKCALPVYALAEIREWESAYETALKTDQAVLLHTNTGKDEDFSEQTGVTWADRPPVAYKRDIRLPGTNGQISREGRYFLDVIDPFFQQALNMGLILPVQAGNAPNDKYTFECLILDKGGWNYSFDALEYAALPGAANDGVLLKGRAIANYFARKNGANADDCVRKIELLDAGIFNNPMPRAVAEDRAKRIIRKNTPLFLHLKRSLPMMQAVSDAIDEANKSSLSMQLVPTFAKSIAFDILREGEQHFYKIHLGGRPVPLCRMIGGSFETGSAAVFFKKGFHTKLLFDAFVNETAVQAEVVKTVKAIWEPMVYEGVRAKKEYLEFLQAAKNEADEQMAMYFADDTTMARRQLFREMHLEDMEDILTQQLKALYQGIIDVYNNLQELM